MFHDTIIQNLITLFSDPRTIISIIAVGTSIGTFWVAYNKGKKSEQMKIAMSISDKLDEADNKIFQIQDELKKSENKGITSDINESALKENLIDTKILHMNHWEFYSLLVNIGELDNKKIKKHFEESFIDETDEFFSEFPEYIKKKGKFSEIKELRKSMKKELKLPTG